MAIPLPRLKHTPRACSVCGDKYNRRNLVVSWTTQNQGHRTGWGKTELKVCMRCSGEPQARRLVIVAATRRRRP